MSDLYSVYRILCSVNGKSYVGRSMQAERRQKDHFSHLRLNKHHSKKLQRAYNKHGCDNFHFEILQTSITEEDVSKSEIAWIEWFDSYHNGYNETLGGDTPPLHRRPIEWDGIEYPSVTAAAKAIGVNREAMNAWLMAGHTAETKKQGNRKFRSVTYNDITYNTVTEAAKANGLTHSGMQNRIKYGYAYDTDVLGNSEAHSKPCSWNGIQYSSSKAMGEALGISGTSARKRLRKGYTCDADMPFRRK